MKAHLALLTASVAVVANADPWATRYAECGTLRVTNLASAPFPHPQRAEGHRYKDKVYPAEPHYRDSTVAIFIPKGLRVGRTVDFVVHFHGWNNHVESVLGQFKLIEQLAESRRNAVLVVPQGPRDAPDSFGGKLEDRDGFQRFMTDVLAALKADPRFAEAKLGRIILSGHSGGYHGIAFILARGGLAEHVKEVWLFDALYGQTEKFAAWLGNSQGRLAAIYTDGGGTKAETEKWMTDLRVKGTALLAGNDREAKAAELRRNRLVFLHTDLGHDDVLAQRRTFRTFLETSCLEPIGAGQTWK